MRKDQVPREEEMRALDKEIELRKKRTDCSVLPDVDKKGRTREQLTAVWVIQHVRPALKRLKIEIEEFGKSVTPNLLSQLIAHLHAGIISDYEARKVFRFWLHRFWPQQV